MGTYILLLIALFLFFVYYTSMETYTNEKNKECSTAAINDAVYNYRVNELNKGAR